MLDEILEYQQYSFNIDSKEEHVQRLKHKPLIVSDFSGITRALTIVARHFYFEYYRSDEDWKEETTNALMIWLGFQVNAITEETKNIQKWLPQYAEKVLLGSEIKPFNRWLDRSLMTDKEKAEIKVLLQEIINCEGQRKKIEAAEQLKEKCDSYGFIPPNKQTHKAILNIELFLQKLSRKQVQFAGNEFEDVGEDNDLYSITYDRIIGNARRGGELKRYYLACDHLMVDYIKKTDGWSRLTDNDYDIVMKMTACCILSMSKKGKCLPSQSMAVHVNSSDFINWLMKDSCKPTELQKYKYKKNPLFELEYVGNNVRKTRLNQCWMDDCGFSILEETSGTDVIQDFLEKHPDGAVFIDRGTGKSLKEIRNTK